MHAPCLVLIVLKILINPTHIPRNGVQYCLIGSVKVSECPLHGRFNLSSRPSHRLSRAMFLIFFKGKKDHEDTNADEIASYVFAGLGFYFQYNVGFSAPFPLNIILFPVEMAESYIHWTVTN